MVKHNFVVLDGASEGTTGVFKSVPEIYIKFPMYDTKLIERFRHDANTHNLDARTFEAATSGMTSAEIAFAVRSGTIIKPDRYEETWIQKWDFPFDVKPRYRESIYERIKKEYNFIPFTPFLVFNISPNWKGAGVSGKPSKARIESLKTSIKNFFEISQRFTRIDYAIEGGSENTHLHAHVVARINPKLEKTVITQLHKGNLANGYRKVWEKQHNYVGAPEGIKGVMKGKFAIQTSLMRKEEFLQDKLDYLVEEKKPEDHQNMVDLGERETIYF